MDWEAFAERMATMARDLLAQESLDATLERISACAVEIVEGCDAAGILVLHGERVETLAPTESMVVRSDRLQQRLGEGPCFDAAVRLSGERAFRIHDFTRPQERWASYVGRARELGIGSMMGFLLYTWQENLGALNLYSRRPAAFTKASETAAGCSPRTPRSPSPAPAPPTSSSRRSRPGTPSGRPWASSWNASRSPRTTPSR